MSIAVPSPQASLWVPLITAHLLDMKCWSRKRNVFLVRVCIVKSSCLFFSFMFIRCNASGCRSENYNVRGGFCITSQSFSLDDPELWDFTLDGIDMLDDPIRESSGLPHPATPSKHVMVTRSKTPQRCTSLRPPLQPYDHQAHQGQGGANYRPNNSATQNTARGPGETNLCK